jgi:hypothetical protein
LAFLNSQWHKAYSTEREVGIGEREGGREGERERERQREREV